MSWIKTESDYIIYTDDTNYYAKNGITGIVDFSSTFGVGTVTNYCMDQLGIAGGIVHFTQGTYNVETPIKIRKASRIEGEGKKATVLKASDNIDAIVTNYNYGDALTDTYCEMANIQLYGNKDNYTCSGIKGYFFRAWFDNICIRMF